MSKNVNVSQDMANLSLLITPNKKNESITQDDFSAEDKKERSFISSTLPIDRKENASSVSPLKKGSPSKKLTLNRTTSNL